MLDLDLQYLMRSRGYGAGNPEKSNLSQTYCVFGKTNLSLGSDYLTGHTRRTALHLRL